MHSVSIVIPAYNEETNIRLGAIDKVLFYLEKQIYDWELIIVDDGSTDKTRYLLDEVSRSDKRIRLIINPHQGKAATVISGMQHAKHSIIVFSDLDQATPIDQLEKILPWFERGFDIVIGSRNSTREGAPIIRRIMAKGFIILRSYVLGLGDISDTQCGFKAFKREITENIFSRLLLYKKGKIVSGAKVTAGFDIETLFVSKKFGYKIKEVPVEWHYVETRRVNPLKDSLQGIHDIIMIRINSLRKLYS